MTKGNKNYTGQVYKILIVDDEREVLNALRMALKTAKQFKCEIITAENVDKALIELENTNFDLVLSDYKMPGENGIELLNYVKDAYPSTLRMLITGCNDLSIAKEAINKAEIHHYIEKPWDNKELRSEIYDTLVKKNEVEPKKTYQTKQKIMDWIMKIYNDAKGMGLDLEAVDHYVQLTISALETNDWEKALSYVNQSFNFMMELAEASNPELIIKDMKNIQLHGDKWSAIELEITNKGNIHATEIKLDLKGEFESKPIETIPHIEMNQTISVPVEIYPKQKGIFPLEIRLTCKKRFDNSEYSFKDTLWIQIGDLLGKTKLKRKFGYDKGYIKMELNIINEDLRYIKDVDFELIFDENILNLTYINPIYSKHNKKFRIGNINPRDGKNIVIYFDPMSCTDTFIGGGISFLDWQDNEKYIMLTPQKIRILCPKLLTNEDISIMDLKNLLEGELTYSGTKIVSIPLGITIEDTYRSCKELIFRYNTKLVREIVEKNPYIIEAWFFGRSEDTKYKFVIKVRLDQNINSIELYIASSNNAALTGLLTDVLSNLNKDLEAGGIIMQPLRQIDNIALKENLISSKRSLLYDQLEVLEKDLEVDFAQRIMEESSSLAEKFERLARKEQFLIGKRRDLNGRPVSSKSSPYQL